MITSIILHGFQSHVDTTIHLGPGLNVITGPSDSGKTAILRSFKWVAVNEPTGESFVNHGTGEAIVTIKTTAGDITKTRKGKKTTYEVNGTIYEKSEVPDEVKEILGIEYQSFADFEVLLNIAAQLEKPFLLGEPPSTGAKVLGKLANAEVIDRSIRKNSKAIYNLNSDRQKAEREIITLVESLQNYTELETVEKCLEMCQSIAQDIDTKKSKLGSLEKALADYTGKQTLISVLDQRLKALGTVELAGHTLSGLEDIFTHVGKLKSLELERVNTQAKLERAVRLLEHTHEVDKCTEILVQIENLMARLTAIETLNKAYNQAGDNIAKAERTLSLVRGVQDAYPMLEAVEGLLEKIKGLQQVEKAYVQAKETYARAGSSLEKAVGILEKTEKELAEAWASLDICPLCERKL